MTAMHKAIIERECVHLGLEASALAFRLRSDWPRDEGEDGTAPTSAEDFAHRAILAICSGGVSAAVGWRAYERCRRALALGASVRIGFRHPGKADAIDRIWRERAQFYRRYLAAADKRAVLNELPWIGPVTKRRLALSFGLSDTQTGQGITEPLKAAA